MNIIEILDPADDRLNPYRDLRFEDVHKRGQRYIAEGRLVVKRLLQSRHRTESVLAERQRLDELRPLVRPETPIYLVDQSLIREVAGFNFHRGLLACGLREPLLTMDSLHHQVSAADQPLTALALLSINDVENLGSLMRTSAALGIQDILLNRQTADPFCRRALRVSMGAALKLRFYDFHEPGLWLTQHAAEWQSIATTLASDSVSIDRVPPFAGPRMIVMGSEGDGLPADIQAACTVRAKIPMAVGIDSLNVSVAGAITLYELLRDTLCRNGQL